MRYILVLFMIVLLLCSCGGEKGEKGKTDDGNTAGPASASDAGPAVSSAGGIEGNAVGQSVSGSAGGAEESDLQKKSRQYAAQLASGLTDFIEEDMTPQMKIDIPPESLLASWNSVAGTLGAFQEIDSVEETQEEVYRVVLVTMRYPENHGVTIKFVYDGEGKIAGLWFEQVMLESADGDAGAAAYTEKNMTVGRPPHTLRGKLTLPTGGGKAPVVILVAGAEMDMDGTLNSGSFFLRDLARGLAREGYASLRYNKRAYQYASVMPGDAGVYETLLEDVWYAIDQMFNERRVDSSRLYLLAQGTAADYLPAMIEKKAGRLSGAVMIAGKAVRRTEYSYGKDSREVNNDARYLIDKNSVIPLLLLQGEADFETSMTDFVDWQKLFKGRSHVVYHSYKKLNHYLMPSGANGNATDYDSVQVLSQKAITDIADWLRG